MYKKPADPYEGNLSTVEIQQELQTKAQLLLYLIAEKRPKIQQGGFVEEEEIDALFNKIEDMEEVIEALTSFDIPQEEKRKLLEAEEKLNKSLDKLEELPSVKKVQEQSSLLLEALKCAEEGLIISKEIVNTLY